MENSKAEQAANALASVAQMLRASADPNSGYRRRWFYPNGYGASVINNPFSYGNEDGLYELAVLKGTADDYDLCYDTPITVDVLGWLTPRDVAETLKKIQALPKEN